MSSVLPPSRPLQGKSNINGVNKELDYDPQCGMSKEEFEWRRSRVSTVCQRVPEALYKFQIESEKVRLHFRDDPRALKIWDEYIHDVHLAASRNLKYSLSLYAQKSGLYEQLMRHACSNTSVGMLVGRYDKLKRATRNKMVPIAVVVASTAAAFATGLGPRLSKQQQANDTKQ
ncbi:uncharacterized protein LOC133889943 [Phragmites australis]|uniref:uncharacterized protein LOC133889943 n=1 Tax=Phragmites australis TaxID=29695 RepID=UPI002D783DEE|nr:uncharacterized protein LOC133889943 [Phragmites australis]